MKEKLLNLLKKNSFKEGNFTLTSGIRSNYFIDCKNTLLTAEGHKLSAKIILDIISNNNLKIHGVAGVELGGCSLASSVSTLSFDLDALYIRKNAKEHGTKKLIEGSLPINSNVILLEDAITSGKSSISALSVLIKNNYIPKAIICIVDRLEGGSEKIQKEFNIPVISIFTIKDFIK